MLAIALAAAAAAVATPAHAQAAPPPLGLRAVLDSVTARYPLVLAAQAQMRAAQGSRVTAGVFGNPILGYQVGYNVDNALAPSGSAARVLDREADWTLTLPLEPLYQRASRVRRADAEVRAASNDAQAERQRAALDATQAYYRTAIAEVGAGTARDLVVWLDSLVAYNRSRAAEGVAAGADLIRAEVERDRAAADATVQEAELAQAKADLAAFLGTSPAATPRLRVVIYAHPLALPAALTPAMQSGASAQPAAGAELQ
ncbi:MAG: TolC family protein, partial [Gemmatimonadaceae bacterium]